MRILSLLLIVSNRPLIISYAGIEQQVFWFRLQPLVHKLLVVALSLHVAHALHPVKESADERLKRVRCPITEIMPATVVQLPCCLMATTVLPGAPFDLLGLDELREEFQHPSCPLLLLLHCEVHLLLFRMSFGRGAQLSRCGVLLALEENDGRAVIVNVPYQMPDNL